MSSYESFYGGRQGASFVFSKRFDGIDIPENSVCRIGWYAKDNEGYFIVPLIERTGDNYQQYTNWSKLPKDGVTTVTSKTGQVSDPVPLEYAEGMIQFFKKGIETTSEVGFGSYVIIDAGEGLGDFSNPDNGKVFCRGLDFTNDLGGAEYIAQLRGPQGQTGGLHVLTEFELQPGETYKDYLDDNIPPEDMVGGTEEDKGWGILITNPLMDPISRTIYTYDYIHRKWVILRDASSGGGGSVYPYDVIIVDASKIVGEEVVPADDKYANNPNEEGIWLIKNNINVAY